MLSRHAVVIVVSLGGALLAGCAPDVPRAALGDHPERLDGIWHVEMRADHALPLGRDAARLPPALGDVAILQSPAGLAGAGLPGPATHQGTWTMNLRPFGVAAGQAPQVQVLSARLFGDSVQMVLGTGEGRVLMRGTLAGDSILGGWSYETRFGGADGRFRMSRR